MHQRLESLRGGRDSVLADGEVGNAKLPLAVVVAVRFCEVLRFSTVIVAPATTAPDVSVTSPEIVPVMVCARLGRLKQTNRSEPTTEGPQTDRMSCPLGNFGCHARCWLGNKFSADFEKVNTIRERLQ